MAGLVPAINVFLLCREHVDARDIGVRKHAVLRTAKRGHDVWNLEMSPDLYFALTLIVKMAVTAAFLLAATITAERAGPLIGGLVATLPISAGPVYIFLALDHDAHFIAQSALGSLVTNAYNVIFAVAYALLAQKRTLMVSFGIALVVWIGLISVGGAVSWTLVSATALN